MPNVFEQQSLPGCPRCDEPVIMVIMQVDKPTKYVHARNNQEDLIHEDLTIEMGKDNG
jgi:hypothetical protein